MSNPSDSESPEESENPKDRRGPQASIKARVVRLVLVPGVVALVLWLAASGYLVFTGLYDREVANSVRNASIPAVDALASIQRERRLSIVYVTDPAKGLGKLITQRQEADEKIAALRVAANSALANAPDSIATKWQTLAGYLDRLAGVRSTIDAGSASRGRIYEFYNGLLDSAISLFDTQARVVPDVTATQGGIAATEIFRAGDLMSRSGSIITGAFGSKTLSETDYLQFTTLIGAYHAELNDVVTHLRPSVQQKYAALTAGNDWRRLMAAENAITVHGPWDDRIPSGLPVGAATWESSATAVSNALIEMTTVQADEVSAEALNTGNTALLTALGGSLAALLISAAAILWAVRQSRVLVDQALSVRLAQLGEDAAAVVDQRLPEMMERLRRREKVDPAMELRTRDYGRDEIGRLAEVLNRSLHAAVDAAVEEAKTRAASVTMLMGVARRPQRPLQRGLQVIEDLQNRVADEALLPLMFDLNHQLAQTRRFLENLIILAGGHTGRRFPQPVPVGRVLLAAIAETRQYRRITLRRAPDVALVGSAVASTTHLVAELLDNALAFSPPESEVWISCSRARRGVVVEIEDAGVGMSTEDREQANALLADAPTLEVTALKDGTQIGLWVVAEIARRAGIQVTLRTSAYGGLLAIVLLPETMIAAGADAPTMTFTNVGSVLGGAEPEGFGPGDPAQGPRLPAVVGGPSGGPRMQARPAGALAVAVAEDDEEDTSAALAQVVVEAPVVEAPAEAAKPAPAGRPPLPQRRPQEHLQPKLNEEEPGAPFAQAKAPARSPEQARSRFSQYQEGWRAGRNAGDTPPRS